MHEGTAVMLGVAARAELGPNDGAMLSKGGETQPASCVLPSLWQPPPSSPYSHYGARAVR